MRLEIDQSDLDKFPLIQLVMVGMRAPAHDPPSNSPLKTKGGGPDRARGNLLALFHFSVSFNIGSGAMVVAISIWPPCSLEGGPARARSNLLALFDFSVSFILGSGVMVVAISIWPPCSLEGGPDRA